MRQFAYLEFAGNTYWSAHEPAPHEPFSAVVNLIQAVYQDYPARAFSMLRRRIFSNYRASVLDKAIVKIAAKRITDSLEFTDPREMAGAIELKSPVVREEPAVEFDLTQGIGACLDALEANCVRREKQHQSDRALAAVVLGPDRKLEGAAWNAISTNRTFHAEVRALQQYWRKHGRPLPKGTLVACSLKPCRMCAAMIWQMSEDPFSLKVIYREFDPGTAARGTVLNIGENTEHAKLLESSPVELSFSAASVAGLI